MSRPQSSLGNLPQPQNQPIRAQKGQKALKLRQNEKSEFKEIKVVQLHEQIPKQFWSPIPTPKTAQ